MCDLCDAVAGQQVNTGMSQTRAARLFAAPRGHRWSFALFALALFFSVSAEAGIFEETLKKAEQNDAKAQLELGNMYFGSRPVALNEAEALKRRYPYRHVHDIVKNEAEAFNWYRKAAEQGEAEAQYNLGWMYERARGVAQKGAEAIT